MSSLWEDIKKTVMEGVTIATEKTEEYTKIGKVKVEILSVKRNVEKAFAQLGGEVYTLLVDKKVTDVAGNPKVKQLIEKINGLKKSLKAKEKEIEAIKKETSTKGQKKTAKPTGTTPVKKTGTKTTDK